MMPMNDEFNLTWLPTLVARWSPIGQQVMIPTPGQTKKHYGIGAVNYHSGETVVLIRKHKRRIEIAELLETLLDQHPNEIIYVTWDNANLIRMLKLKLSCVGLPVGLFCCICQHTAPG